MTTARSALYVGKVWHRRWKPKAHRLDYRVFSALVDLDELPALASRSRVFSHNRFNLFSFMDRDFGPGDGSPLKPWVAAQLRAAGLEADDLRVALLCYPRMFGYAFNPLSVYFCRRCADGVLIAILYEVHNTFGQRHCYLIPAGPESRMAGDVVRQICAKSFYVSPFIDMQATYHFRILPPAAEPHADDRLAVVIHQTDLAGRLLDASFIGGCRDWSDAALLSLLATHPLMTLKVIAGIHWEAMRLWLKGVKLVRRPAPPQDLVSLESGGMGTQDDRDEQVQSNRRAA
jgi:DUF1365 family protein